MIPKGVIPDEWIPVSLSKPQICPVGYVCGWCVSEIKERLHTHRLSSKSLGFEKGQAGTPDMVKSAPKGLKSSKVNRRIEAKNQLSPMGLKMVPLEA